MKKTTTTLAFIILSVLLLSALLFSSCSRDTYHCKVDKGNCRDVSDVKFIIE